VVEIILREKPYFMNKKLYIIDIDSGWMLNGSHYNSLLKAYKNYVNETLYKCCVIKKSGFNDTILPTKRDYGQLYNM